jgi:hypothetical protein
VKGYAKIWRRIWIDEKFRALPVHPDQFIVLYMLSCASNRVGLFTVSVGDLSERLDLPPADCRSIVERVCLGMGWGWDRPTSTVWIQSWWRWNPPESPKAVLGYLRDLDDVPESSLRTAYVRTEPGLTDSLSKAYRKAIDSLLVRARVRAQTKPEPEHDPEALSNSLAKPQSSEKSARLAGAHARGWKPDPAIVADLRAQYPAIDLDTITAEVRTAHEHGKVRKPDAALRSWVAAAHDRGTHGLKPAADPDADFLRSFESRLVAYPHLSAFHRTALWAKAQDAKRQGASVKLVLWGRDHLRAWIAEIETGLREAVT